LVALILAGQLVTQRLDLHSGSVVFVAAGTSIAADLLLLAVVGACARRPAKRGGGWPATFGIAQPRLADLPPSIAGFIVAFVGQLVIGVLANDATGGRATRQAQNLRLHSVHGIGLDLLTLAVVVVAPLVEEFMFRGVLLRTFMRRMTFWPAAVLSTALFAGFHVYEVDTVAGAVTLAAGVAILGLTNCCLVRITGRLTPGMLTHASFNLVAVLILAATGR
jgi:membrane protease YdiL (CAAX protease family)